MNATPYYTFNNYTSLPCTPQEQNNNGAYSAHSALGLYNMTSAHLETAQPAQQPVKDVGFTQPQKRKTTVNRSRTLYNKRLLVNARERERMKTLNKGFQNLRNALPCYIADGHISKITTLRLAINYIKTLSAVLEEAGSGKRQLLLEQQPLLQAMQSCDSSLLPEGNEEAKTFTSLETCSDETNENFISSGASQDNREIA